MGRAPVVALLQAGSKAAKVGCGRYRARDGERLAALIAIDDVDHPSSQNCLLRLVGVGHPRASVTKWQIVGSGDMETMRSIDVTESVIGCNPEIWKPLGPILLILSRLRVLIAHTFAPCVIGKH